MTARPRATKAQFIAGLRAAARNSHETGDEMTAMADSRELALIGHECGHQFTISFTSILHAGIADEGPASHRDLGTASMPRSVTVRAHDLPSALRRAAALPLIVWYPEEGDD